VISLEIVSRQPFFTKKSVARLVETTKTTSAVRRVRMHGSFFSTCFHDENTEKLDFFASFFGNALRKAQEPKKKKKKSD